MTGPPNEAQTETPPAELGGGAVTTASEISRLAALRRSPVQIAEELGITRQAVNQQMAKLGIKKVDHRKLTDEEIARRLTAIDKAARDGKSLEDYAGELGISIHALVGTCRKYRPGLKVRVMRPTDKRPSPAVRAHLEAAEKLAAEGVPISKAAKIIGVSYQSIAHAVRKYRPDIKFVDGRRGKARRKKDNDREENGGDELA